MNSKSHEIKTNTALGAEISAGIRLFISDKPIIRQLLKSLYWHSKNPDTSTLQEYSPKTASFAIEKIQYVY